MLTIKPSLARPTCACVLQVALEAGPAAVLAVAEPQPLRTGLRAVLPLLRVHAADAHGNPATCPKLRGAALAAIGEPAIDLPQDTPSERDRASWQCPRSTDFAQQRRHAA